jgi:hypothetical protein
MEIAIVVKRERERERERKERKVLPKENSKSASQK